MRVIQNAALFGLIGGTGLLIMGMAQGWAALSIAGAGLGIMIGVPAAYLHFAMQGMDLFNRQGIFGKIQDTVRERMEQQKASVVEAKRQTGQHITPFVTPEEQSIDVPIVVGSKPSTPEVIRPERVAEEPPPLIKAEEEVVTPVPATKEDEAISIPIRIIPPETPETKAEELLAEVLPDPEPEAPPVIELPDTERKAIIEEIQAATADDVDHLLELAIHKDTLIRLYAVQKLGELGDPSVEPVLGSAYTDDDEVIVRRAARLSLSKLGLNIPEPVVSVEENGAAESASESGTHD